MHGGREGEGEGDGEGGMDVLVLGDGGHSYPCPLPGRARDLSPRHESTVVPLLRGAGDGGENGGMGYMPRGRT